jgi:opacity protein-like surface antigen
MKRIMTVLALAAFAAAPAAAQWLGMPVWNSPKGGTGVTISGDLGMPNADYGKGTAFGARGSIGLGTLTLGAGVASWKPDGATQSLTSIGATGEFRVIGGSLLPVALNLQVGAGRASTSGAPSLTTFLAGAGASVNVPTPGINIEPYLSVTNRWHKIEGISGTESNIGWVIGANVGLGMLGLHVAYDSEKDDSGVNNGVIGIGVHFSLKVPLGM